MRIFPLIRVAIHIKGVAISVQLVYSNPLLSQCQPIYEQ
jgi:hypothetical protein